MSETGGAQPQGPRRGALAKTRGRPSRARAWSAVPPPGRRTFPPQDWADALPAHLALIAALLIPDAPNAPAQEPW